MDEAEIAGAAHRFGQRRHSIVMRCRDRPGGSGRRSAVALNRRCAGARPPEGHQSLLAGLGLVALGVMLGAWGPEIAVARAAV